MRTFFDGVYGSTDTVNSLAYLGVHVELFVDADSQIFNAIRPVHSVVKKSRTKGTPLGVPFSKLKVYWKRTFARLSDRKPEVHASSFPCSPAVIISEIITLYLPTRRLFCRSIYTAAARHLLVREVEMACSRMLIA